MIYTEDVHTRMNDFDGRGQMTVSAMLKNFETVSNHHAASVGVMVMDTTLNNGIGWVLTDWRIGVERTPTYKDKLHIETWLFRSTHSSRTSRDALLKDDTGEVLVRASAKIALVRLADNKPLLLSDSAVAPFQPESIGAFPDRLPRLRVPVRYDSGMPVVLRRSDMDYNGHLHNTAYLDIAMELAPKQIREEGIHSFRISYRLPLRYGDTVTLKGAPKDGGWAATFFRGETPYAVLALNEILQPL